MTGSGSLGQEGRRRHGTTGNVLVVYCFVFSTFIPAPPDSELVRTFHVSITLESEENRGIKTNSEIVQVAQRSFHPKITEALAPESCAGCSRGNRCCKSLRDLDGGRQSGHRVLGWHTVFHLPSHPELPRDPPSPRYKSGDSQITPVEPVEKTRGYGDGLPNPLSNPVSDTFNQR